MSVIGSNILAGASGQAVGYQVSRSLRFNSSDSVYLGRTPASAGNRRTWTFSAWVKRSSLPASQQTLLLINAGSGNQTSINIESGQTILLYQSTAGVGERFARTTQVFRDVSAWMHLVFSIDTNQSVNADRVRIYVNGILLSTYSTYSDWSAVDTFVSTTNEHRIGSTFDGYLAEIHFIDGQALTPSSFTEVSATTGQLIPKAYTGSFGTNGFWLKFSDNSAATATTLGKDYSGNGNNWTPTNFSVAAGAGNDSLVDTPTSYGTDDSLGGSVRGNYCTLNPLDANTAITLSNGNLDFSQLGNFVTVARATIALPASGKWYFEYIPTGGPAQGAVGISASNVALTNTTSGNCVFYQENAKRNLNGSVANYGATFTTNDVIGVAHDADSGQVTFYKNNVSQGAISFTPGFSYFPAISPFNVVGNLNFGQRPFAYTAPSGFKALCDTNLPAPVVAKPSTVFDTKLYTGNGSSQTITGLAFSPDFVWIKERNSAENHQLQDAVRGATNRLFSNLTAAESADAGSLTSFNSDGFSLGSAGNYNGLNDTYAAWCWDAGTSTVTNTQGSITSSVRANASAGFSIVTYTGNSSDNQTIGHGLGAAPAMIIVKRRDAGFGWIVGHTSIGWSNFVQLHSTAASASTPALFANTAPTSTVFSVSVAGNGSTNSNGNTFVAYCFAPVAGYTSAGSYTGNGSADGPFVYTSMRPRWILLKRTDSTGNWTILDTAREGYNVDNDPLYPNLADAEGTADLADILSNGFKLRSTDASANASAGTYIYFAISEAAFQYARAR